MSQDNRKVRIVSNVRAEVVENPLTSNKSFELVHHIEEHDGNQNEADHSVVSFVKLL